MRYKKIKVCLPFAPAVQKKKKKSTWSANLFAADVSHRPFKLSDEIWQWHGLQAESDYQPLHLLNYTINVGVDLRARLSGNHHIF